MHDRAILLSPRLAALACLSVVMLPAPAALAAGSPANAGPFLEDILSRGTASVRGWPDDAIASPIDKVEYMPVQQCALTIAAKNGHRFVLHLDKAASVQILAPPEANSRYVDISGGAAPYESVSIFVDDADSFKRIANAFTVLFKACDKSRSLGF